MKWLWTTADLIAAMHGRPIGNLPQGVTGISIDSREIGAGEAFFAIKGDRVDGHDFASFAVANGAALLVVSEGKLPALGRLVTPMIVVQDVLQAGDTLIVAGKGHEEGQTVGTVTLPFSDHAELRAALGELDR